MSLTTYEVCRRKLLTSRTYKHRSVVGYTTLWSLLYMLLFLDPVLSTISRAGLSSKGGGGYAKCKREPRLLSFPHSRVSTLPLEASRLKPEFAAYASLAFVP